MLRIFLIKPLAAALILAVTTLPAYAQDTAVPPPIKETDILPYLEQVIAWTRSISDTETLPDNGRETLLKNRLRDNSKKVLLKGFDFARAENAVLKLDKTTTEAATTEVMETRKSRIQKSIGEAREKIDGLNVKLKAKGLGAHRREKLSGQMKLANAQYELLLTMLKVFSNEGDKSGSLLDQINALSRTVVDETQVDVPATTTTTVVKEDSSKDKDSLQEGDGMLKLIATMFSYSRKSSEIENIIQQTNTLYDANGAMMTSIRAALKGALTAGDTLSANNGDDDKAIKTYRQSLDELLNHYRLLSNAVVPLGEMSVLLSAPQRDLAEWDRILHDDWSRVFHQLIVRLVVLVIAVAIPLVLSELARRATKRYVQDPKRQRQLHIARRTVLFMALTFVVLANFLSEFGSLATFAGFITAGLAVGLQTVLISLAAHFFYFGRYGVRAGDRITVSGVTGDVVQVGMLRLYLRELLDDGAGGYKATGKVVAFPNSILFQPSAFYKHVDAH